jgi:hypothetical protein
MKRGHPERRAASNKLTTGDDMKRVSILAISLLSASLAHVGVAQSAAGAPTNTDASTQTKQDKKDAKAKAKPPIKASTGKKTATSQDAAYALAARKGSPEPHPTTPPK